MWEIDENLVRAELTKMELADHLVRRKAEYLKRHPETQKGGDFGNQHTGGKARLSDNLSFSQDTAAKTGTNKRTIERGVRRGKKIVPDVLHDVVGTKLDSGAALDRLAKLEPTGRRKTLVGQPVPPTIPVRTEERKVRSTNLDSPAIRRRPTGRRKRSVVQVAPPILARGEAARTST